MNDDANNEAVVLLNVISCRWQILFSESELLAFDRSYDRLSESLGVFLMNYCLSTRYTHKVLTRLPSNLRHDHL